MITVVSMNACIDKTAVIDNLSLLQTNRIRVISEDIGGKGINVATVLSNFGVECICTGFSFSGREIAHLDKSGVKYDFVTVEKPLRTNLKIYDNNGYTEINEMGNSVGIKEVELVKEKIIEYGKNSIFVILTGSVPQGVDASFYKDMITTLRKFNVNVLLDADEALLSEGISAKPYMIKPNIYELQRLFKKEYISDNEAIEDCRALIDSGITTVCLSMGEKGAYYITENSILYSPPLNLEVKALQGAGDSMVAGMAYAIDKGLSEEEVLKWGMAAAGASIIKEGTSLATMEDTENLMLLLKKCI